MINMGIKGKKMVINMKKEKENSDKYGGKKKENSDIYGKKERKVINLRKGKIN